MKLVFRPTPADLEAVLAREGALELTYPEVGATADELPAGYDHGRHRVVMGQGDEVFRRARLGIQQWAAHRSVGLRLVPATPPLVAGTAVLVDAPLGPVHVLALTRIVYVVHDEWRFGFAYGTLPTHPEEGEEAFVVTRSPSGEVAFEVVVFSRPRHPLVR
ncbi:MAG TPA: DUF1990 domain-containing protein, partial [Acidimicrobiales bacterium]|nr:DUF1990 domain-containing protein [Acidimicrobiales bacterium]